MKLKISVPVTGMPSGISVYRSAEYSFDVHPSSTGSFTSLLVNNLSLELNAEGKVISVWGLCPHVRWTSASLVPPEAEFAEVFVADPGSLVAGVSEHINGPGHWPVLVDRQTGWVCVRGSEGAVAAKILNGVAIEIANTGELSALWLKPDQLPKL